MPDKEERDGVRYHGAIPFSLLFSRLLEQIPAPEAKAQIWQGVEKALGAAAAAGAGTAAAGALGTGAGEAAKTGLFATIKAKIIAGVTAAAVVTGGAVVVISNLPDPIVFSDPAMEQNIRVLIHKPEGKIYPEDCQELSHLTILPDGFIVETDNAFYNDPHPEEGTVPVESLADLQKLPQVTSLQFIQGDAQPLLDTLGENPYLQEVDATWRDTQDLTDLSFVQDLPNLRNLYCTIGDNVDLTPLQNCPQLEAYSSSMGQNPPSVPQLDTQAFMDTYTHPLMDEIFYGSSEKEE